MLIGFGRKIEADSGVIYEGQFTHDTLNGFGRVIWSDGYYCIGFWKQGLLHGYAQRIIGGTSDEGQFEKASLWFLDKPKKKKEIFDYNPDIDMIAHKRNFK